MRRPVPIIVLIFSAGIVVSAYLSVSYAFLAWSAGALVAFIGMHYWLRRRSCVCVVLLVFFLGMFCLRERFHAPDNHIAEYIRTRCDPFCSLKGMVRSYPVRRGEAVSFLLSSKEVRFSDGHYRCSGEILVFVRGKTTIRHGDYVVLSGQLNQSLRNHSYGIMAKSPLSSYWRQQYYVNVHPFHISAVGSQGRDGKVSAYTIFESLYALFKQYLSPISCSMATAMILGRKTAVPEPLRLMMARTGTVHLLVLSGFGVGVVSYGIVLVLKALRVRNPLRIYITVPILVFYGALTGWSVPVVRATTMVIIILGAQLCKRETDVYNTLALAAGIILAQDPIQLFSVGFQLSFGTVISIAFFYPVCRNLFRIQRIPYGILRVMAEGMVVSLSAWLGSGILVLYYFKIFSPISIVANYFLIPLAAVLILCGWVVLVFAVIHPPLASIAAVSYEILTAVFLRINQSLMGIPGAYRIIS